MTNHSDNVLNSMIRKSFVQFLFFAAILSGGALLSIGGANYCYAATSGTISTPTPDYYAYGENIGWINFSPTTGSVVVANNGLTGYAWSENAGWIKLGNDNGPPYSNSSSTDWGISNNSGKLSGYAYAENLGWINFDPQYGGHDYGVNIDSSGNFSGYAWGENTGWISFNCSNANSCANNGGYDYEVLTNWHPTGTLSTLTISPANSTITVCQGQSYTAEGFDQYDNDLGDVTSATTFTVSGSNSGWNGDVYSNSTAGTYTITGTDGSVSGTTSLTVTSANCGGGGEGGVNYYLINVSAGANGSISPASADVANGSNQTFTITPNPGYQVASVLIDGNSVGAVTNYTFSNITASHTISATFSAIVSSGGGGNSLLLNTTSTTAQAVLNFVSQTLVIMKQLIFNLSAIKPTVAPPHNLQPTSPPTKQVPPTAANNQSTKIQIYQKILTELMNLLNLFFSQSSK